MGASFPFCCVYDLDKVMKDSEANTNMSGSQSITVLFSLSSLLPHFRQCDNTVLLRIPSFTFSNSRVYMFVTFRWTDQNSVMEIQIQTTKLKKSIVYVWIDRWIEYWNRP